MKKIIFSSQSSHNLCRGNPKGLDNSQQGLACPLPIDTGEESNFSHAILPPFKTSPVYQSGINCDYFLRCQELNIKCKFPCQTQKFFDKYPDYEQMFIGSRI